jgi:hypothetical protein
MKLFLDSVTSNKNANQDFSIQPIDIDSDLNIQRFLKTPKKRRFLVTNIENFVTPPILRIQW